MTIQNTTEQYAHGHLSLVRTFSNLSGKAQWTIGGEAVSERHVLILEEARSVLIQAEKVKEELKEAKWCESRSAIAVSSESWIKLLIALVNNQPKQNQTK